MCLRGLGGPALSTCAHGHKLPYNASKVAPSTHPGLHQPCAPLPLPLHHPPRRDGSDGDDDYTPRPNKKPVPEWAQPARLLEALRSQQGVDPDKLFDTKIKTCSLAEVFADMPPALPAATTSSKASKKRDPNKRGSSGNWIADRITWQEEINYKRLMGYL